jgi:hypothetical protein
MQDQNQSEIEDRKNSDDLAQHWLCIRIFQNAYWYLKPFAFLAAVIIIVFEAPYRFVYDTAKDADQTSKNQDLSQICVNEEKQQQENGITQEEFIECIKDKVEDEAVHGETLDLFTEEVVGKIEEQQNTNKSFVALIQQKNGITQEEFKDKAKDEALVVHGETLDSFTEAVVDNKKEQQKKEQQNANKSFAALTKPNNEITKEEFIECIKDKVQDISRHYKIFFTNVKSIDENFTSSFPLPGHLVKADDIEDYCVVCIRKDDTWRVYTYNCGATICTKELNVYDNKNSKVVVFTNASQTYWNHNCRHAMYSGSIKNTKFIDYTEEMKQAIFKDRKPVQGQCI